MLTNHHLLHAPLKSGLHVHGSNITSAIPGLHVHVYCIIVRVVCTHVQLYNTLPGPRWLSDCPLPPTPLPSVPIMGVPVPQQNQVLTTTTKAWAGKGTACRYLPVMSACNVCHNRSVSAVLINYGMEQCYPMQCICKRPNP